MKKANVRVESKKLTLNSSWADRERELTKMKRIFKKLCEDYGVLRQYQEHEYFVRKTDKKRKKKSIKLRGALEGEREKENNLFR